MQNWLQICQLKLMFLNNQLLLNVFAENCLFLWILVKRFKLSISKNYYIFPKYAISFFQNFCRVV